MSHDGVLYEMWFQSAICMMSKMNMLTKIRHIFPYLYFRCYQSMYKTGSTINFGDLKFY